MMPIDYKQYPPNWKTEIRPRILARASNRCEFCGVENYSYVRRAKRDVQVILTIAHLDHDKTHNDDANLKALCQRCHLAYDKKHHMDNAKRTRAKTKHATIQNNGQMELIKQELDYEITEGR